MNDITALAQRMKAAALKAKSEADEWGYDTDAFHDEATPDAVIQVVEALEKAQQSNEFLKGQLSELANFNPDWDKLEASYESWREIAAELLVAKDRIASLESRTVTVKLPPEVMRKAQAPQHLSKHDQLCWMSGANWMRMEVVKLNPVAGIQVIEGE